MLPHAKYDQAEWRTWEDFAGSLGKPGWTCARPAGPGAEAAVRPPEITRNGKFVSFARAVISGGLLKISYRSLTPIDVLIGLHFEVCTPICGDGIVMTPMEECDDNNNLQTA